LAAPLIEFQHVTLGYGHRVVLSDLNFAVNEGDFLGIVGPNGAGKTTLLKAILGVLKPQTGKVIFHTNGSLSPAGRHRKIGYVPQRDAPDEMFPLTAFDIVLMARYAEVGVLRRLRQEDEDIARQSLEEVGMGEMARQPFRALSGGQKQRVLIARALATRSRLLLLDEPTNGMDLASEALLMDLIARLHKQHHLTVLLVTHLLNLVANYAHHIAILSEGNFEIGETNDMLTPARLQRLYNIPAAVVNVDGQKVVMVEKMRDEG
jgi:ABC-type Mn2+/Zn2+ transport system ATPase subunit